VGRSEGLPVGGQLIGRMLGEARMLAVAKTLEARLDAQAEVR